MTTEKPNGLARREPETLTIRTAEGEAEHDARPAPRRDLASLDFPALMTMGDALVRTGFLPGHIKTGGQAAAIIMTGRELGMEPMRALRTLKMVQGNVEEDASSQLSRFKVDGGHSTFRLPPEACPLKGACKGVPDPKTGLVEHLDNEHAVLWLRHPNGDEHIESFTIEDAKGAGLFSNPTWKKYPKAMLRSRAITAGLKGVGWEGAPGVYGDGEISFEYPSSGGAEEKAQRAPPKAGDPGVATLERGGATGRAPPSRSATEILRELMRAADEATDEVELEAVRADWAGIQHRFRPENRVGPEAYLEQAHARIVGLTVEPEESARPALAAMYKLRGRVNGDDGGTRGDDDEHGSSSEA